MDACGLWRMWFAHLNIPNSRFLFTMGNPELNEISECDVVVVQRLMTAANIEFFKLMRAHGLKIIYDLDDNVWNLPPKNPAKVYFHRDESVEGLLACAEWADAITTSTRHLQNVVYDKWGHLQNIQTGKDIPVYHFENSVDLNWFRPPAIPRDPNKVVIGWGGSNTHAGDLEFVWQMLPKIVDMYPNVYLEFVGMDAPPSIKDHPRVMQRQWCHISEFANRFATWNWDIVLAPLEDHKFNKSKSGIKMVEAGCISSPCLAQDIAPYRNFANHIPELKWLLCADFEWEKKLHKLIQDRTLREHLGKLMYENVVANFNITGMVDKWKQLVLSVL